MTDRELMQQALYALEYASDMTKPENMSGCGCPICVTITALSDRLAQPERPWVGLTEPERLTCYNLNPARFASAIENSLKEKNT